MIFDEIRSRSVIYGADAGPRLRVRFPDARYLGIWSKPGAPFVCIEPWHGIADPEGFSGDFYAKPGIFVVSPGSVRTMEMSITLFAA
jgi:galactose mutarotase-like enzyme